MSKALALGDTSDPMTPEQELARVMWEITNALGGTSAALTLHPSGQPPTLVHVNSGEAWKDRMVDLLVAGSLDWEQEHPDHHIWISAELELHALHAIALPVRRVPGHSRLVVTVFFSGIDAEQRAVAEAAYLERRPFAVGYFRLWQQDRLHRRDVDALRAVLDRLGIAVMLITKSGEIAFKNWAACTLLAEGNGLYEQRGQLRARDRSDSRVIEDLIDQAIEHEKLPTTAQTTNTVKVQRSDMAPLMVSVAPAPVAANEMGEIAVIVFVVDPDMDISELAKAVCNTFGLTRVEAELACLLASGKTLQEAAIFCRIKHETARSYLRSMFTKTGVNRQVDFIRLILLSLVRTSGSA